MENQFRDITLLSDALTAASADLDNYEGNRRLAPIGVDVCKSLAVSDKEIAAVRSGEYSNLENLEAA